MGDPKKPQRSAWPIPPASPKPEDAADAGAKRAGRVVHDARGNAVWDWSGNPTDSTTHLLRKLDAPDLSLAEDPAEKKPSAPEPTPGLDPYNTRNDRQSAPRGTPAASGEPKTKKTDTKTPQETVLKQLLGKR